MYEGPFDTIPEDGRTKPLNFHAGMVMLVAVMALAIYWAWK
jgi:hypothetical protein